MTMGREYKVIHVNDGSLSAVLDCGRGIYPPLLEACINALAAEGWELLSGATESIKGMWLTFVRTVPEADREARAARCIDDIVTAEDEAIALFAALEEMTEAEVRAAVEAKTAKRRRAVAGSAAAVGILGALLGREDENV